MNDSHTEWISSRGPATCLVFVQYRCARVMLRSTFEFGEPIATRVEVATPILVVSTWMSQVLQSP